MFFFSIFWAKIKGGQEIWTRELFATSVLKYALCAPLDESQMTPYYKIQFTT